MSEEKSKFNFQTIVTGVISLMLIGAISFFGASVVGAMNKVSSLENKIEQINTTIGFISDDLDGLSSSNPVIIGDLRELKIKVEIMTRMVDK